MALHESGEDYLEAILVLLLVLLGAVGVERPTIIAVNIPY